MTKNQTAREARYHELLGRRLRLIERIAEINREIHQIESERAYEEKLATKLKRHLFWK